MARNFDTRPLSPALGAEIIGLDVSQPIDDETIAAFPATGQAEVAKRLNAECQRWDRAAANQQITTPRETP